MGFPVFTINRIVVFLHAGQLSQGNIHPLVMTDLDPGLDIMLEEHLKAGAVLLYDGPPNQEPKKEFPEHLRAWARELVDAAWNAATESESVPATEWADRIINDTHKKVSDGREI